MKYSWRDFGSSFLESEKPVSMSSVSLCMSSSLEFAVFTRSQVTDLRAEMWREEAEKFLSTHSFSGAGVCMPARESGDRYGEAWEEAMSSTRVIFTGSPVG